MSGIISGNMVGGAAPLRTLILTDVDGNEFTGIVTGQEVIFTAGDNDVREGLVYAGDSGVSTGTKFIPSYVTTEGSKLIPAGSAVRIALVNGKHDYTKLQGIICAFNTSLVNSVAAEKVAINDSIYPVQSTIVEATISVNKDSDTIDFGITNTTEKPWVVRYFTYKEVY